MTIMALRVRFRKHNHAPEQGITNYTVPKYFKEVHRQSTKGLQILNTPKPNLSKGFVNKRLIKINNNNNTLSPNGLNEEIETNTVI